VYYVSLSVSVFIFSMCMLYIYIYTIYNKLYMNIRTYTMVHIHIVSNMTQQWFHSSIFLIYELNIDIDTIGRQPYISYVL